HLRILDPRRLYSRRFIDFDLAIACDRPASFNLLCTLAGPRALCSDPQDPRSLHAIVDASDRYAAGVCGSLRDRALHASSEVLRALVASRRRHDRGAVDDAFSQSLTIVYRIVFLLFAESRALVPVWHPVYRNSYTIESLRALVERAPARP